MKVPYCLTGLLHLFVAVPDRLGLTAVSFIAFWQESPRRSP